jgi:TPP-dependent indolepyruvate ferredoxin oxidoreductase alpha subunit
MKPSFTLADALARFLAGAGVEVITHVPGFGATALFEAVRRIAREPPPLSLHEEVAFAISHGAAFRGKRAATLIKAHGLAKAANAVVTALSSGTTAGHVTLVFDDPQGTHSDNILDTPRLLDGLGIPWQRADANGAVAALREAFALSEQRALPVALLLEADICEQPASAGGPPPPPLASLPVYQRDVSRHIVCPLFSRYQRQVLEARLGGQAINSLPRPEMLRVPDGLPATWQPMVKRYVPLFEAFLKVPRAFTTGDTGLSSLFALPPYDAIDLVCYMGGSVPLALGARLGAPGPVWAVTGDFSFSAAGALALLEAAERGLDVKVLLIHNGRSEATGGQPLPNGALGRALAPYSEAVRWLTRPTDPDAAAQALAETASAPDFTVLVADFRPE